MPRTLRVVVLAFACLALLAPAAAWGAYETLAPMPSASAITAYGGHVVWSAYDPATGRWSLQQWHDGTISALPVAPRRVPFDVDAGSDARGRPVAVYSRCAREAQAPRGVAFSPDWATARGCDVYEVSLDGGGERRVRAVSTRSGSETTPSIWHGAIAFARRVPGARVARVLLWRPGGGERRLRGGRAPPCPRSGRCPAAGFHAGVDALDLGPWLLAVAWRVVGGTPAAFGVEILADTLDGRHAALAGSGFVGGACDAPYPVSPAAVRRRVVYVQTIDAPCGSGPEAEVLTFTPRGSLLASVEAPYDVVQAVTSDGSDLLWQVGPMPWISHDGVDDVCRAYAGACTLVRARPAVYDRAWPARITPPRFPRRPAR